MSGANDTPRLNVEIGADLQLDPAFAQGLQSARQFQEKLKAELVAAQQQIAAATKAGLLSTEDAATAGRAAGAAYAAQLAGQIRATLGSTALPEQLKNGRVAGLAAELAQFKQASGAAAGGLSDLASAAQAAGGPLGAAASRVSGLTSVLGTTAGLAGVAGAALLAVGVHAAEMAAQVETHVIRITNALNLTAEQSKAVSADIETFSLAFGRSQKEIAELMQLVTENGPGGAAGLRAMTQAALELAQVTGQDVRGIAQGLDQVIDAFGLSSEHAEQFAADLFAVTKGKVPLEDLFQVLGRVAAQARGAGISLQDLEGATAALLDAGVAPRQLAAELDKLATGGETSRAVLKDLAGTAHDSAKNLAELQSAADAAAHSTEHVGAQLREEMNATLARLGSDLLPVTNAGLSKLADLLERIRAARGGTLAGIGQALLGQLPELEVVPGAGLDRDPTLAAAITKAPTPQSDTEKAAARRVETIKNATKELGDVSRAAVQGYVAELQKLAHEADLGPIVRANAAQLADALTSDMGKVGKALDAKAKELADKQRAIRDQFASSVASLTPDAGDNLRAQRQRLEQQVADPKNDFTKAEADRLLASFDAAVQSHFAQQSKELTKKLRGLLVDGLDSATQAAQQKLDELNDLIEASFRAAATGGGPQVTADQAAQMAAAQQRLTAVRDAAKAAADLKQQLLTVDALERGSDRVHAMERLDQLLDRAADDVRRTKDGTEEHTAALARQAAIQQAIETLQSKTATETERAAAAAKLTASQVGSVAGQIAVAAGAAAGLATVFGGANSELAHMLTGVSAVATGVEKIAEKARTAGGLGSLLSTGKGLTSILPELGGIIAGGGAVVSALQSAFGHSAEDRQHEETLRANTAAIQALTQHVGDLAGLTVSGSAFGQIRTQLDEVVRRLNLARTPDSGTGDSKTILGLLGVDQHDLEAVAKSLGITLDGTAGSFRKLDEAIQHADFKAFADSWSGILAEMQTLEAVDKVTDPIAKLGDFVKALGESGSSAFGKLLGENGVATDSDRAQMRQAARDLLDQFRQGLLDPSALGKLTPQEFLDALKTLIGDIDAVTANVTSAGDAASAAAAAFQHLADSLGQIDLTQQLEGGDPADVIRAKVQAFAAHVPEAFRDAFTHLLDGADLTTEIGRSSALQHIRDFFATLLADGKLDDTEKQIADGLAQIFGDIKDFGQSLADQAEKARQLAISTATQRAQQRVSAFDLKGTDALREQVNAASSLSPVLAALFGGQDLSTAAGLKVTESALEDLFTSIDDGADVAGKGAYSSDELKQAILDLLGAVRQTASGFTEAAKTIADAAGMLNTASQDAKRLGLSQTETNATLTGTALNTPLGTGKTVGEEFGFADPNHDPDGFKKWVASLRKAYSSGTGGSAHDAIGSVLDWAGPLADGMVGGGGGNAAGESTPASSPQTGQLAGQAQSVTREEAVRLVEIEAGMFETLRDILVEDRAQTDALRQMVAQHSAFTVDALPPLTPPQLPAAVMGGGEMHVHFEIGSIALGGSDAGGSTAIGSSAAVLAADLEGALASLVSLPNSRLRRALDQALADDYRLGQLVIGGRRR